MLKCFDTTDQNIICREILDHGELQISEKEREDMQETMFRDVAAIVVDKTVNPENNRPYTLSMIQNAMKQIHFSVNTTRGGAKVKALEVIKTLKTVMPIARAKMRIRIGCPEDAKDEMLAAMLFELSLDILELAPESAKKDVPTAVTETYKGLSPSATPTVNSAEQQAISTFDFNLDPELYRGVQKTLSQVTDNEGFVEVLQLNASSGVAVAEGAKASGAEQAPASSASDSTSAIDTDTSGDIDADAAGGSVGVFRLDVGGDNQKGKNQNKKNSKKNKLQEREKREDMERQAALTKDRDARKLKEQLAAAEKRVSDNAKGDGDRDVESAEEEEVAVVPPKKCNTCGGGFDAAAYRKHFQSEWHRFNLKLKMQDKPMVPSEKAFMALTTAELSLVHKF